MFFKSNKETKTEDLKLSDYDQIWTKFCFLDESGSLANQTEPYFTIGVLKMSMPYYLQSKILYERRKQNFHDEMKFNKLSDKNITFAKFVIGSIFDTKSLSFYSYTTHLVSGSRHKLELTNFLKKKLGATTLVSGFRKHNFNVFVEQDDGEEANEKGPSS